jgi:chorismate lyase/3-hydroxybenzoate synthase
MRAPAGLHLDYLSPAEHQSARWSDVLGVASFNGIPPGAADSGAPVAQVHTRVLCGSPDVYEVWRCGEPVESGHIERVRFRRSEDMLFGCIAVAEADSGRASLHEATAAAYREICAAADRLGYPYLLRVWNYLPDINLESAGLERYRQFNSARQHALREHGRAVSGNVPAASALGAASGTPLVVYFLAGRTPAEFVENPRQVSAYDYPRQYGTHSPAFSRAALLRQGATLALFISGTASIVGHRSTHVGDAAAQTRETLTNIESLLTAANSAAGGPYFDLGSLACKVYVRRPADLAVIQGQLAAALSAGARCVYLQADICRQDLLVEIEATAIRPAAGAALPVHATR